MKKGPWDFLEDDTDIIGELKRVRTLSQRPSLPAKLLRLIERLKKTNDSIAARPINPEQPVDFLLLSFYQTKLELLSTTFMEFSAEDHRILPTYLPQYLDTLSRLAGIHKKDQPAKERDFTNAQLDSLKQILATLGKRKAQGLIHLQIIRYLAENPSLTLPTNSAFFKEYLNSVRQWDPREFSALDLLKWYGSVVGTNHSNSKASASIIISLLEARRHEKESNDDYLARQAALFLFHTEIEYEADKSVDSFTHLSNSSSQCLPQAVLSPNAKNSSEADQATFSSSFEESLLNDWSSLCRAASLLHALNRIPTTDFFIKVADCCFSLMSLDDINPFRLFNTDSGLTMMQTLFKKAEAHDPQFRSKLLKYLHTDDDQRHYNTILDLLSNNGSKPRSQSLTKADVSRVTLGVLTITSKNKTVNAKDCRTIDKENLKNGVAMSETRLGTNEMMLF